MSDQMKPVSGSARTIAVTLKGAGIDIAADVGGDPAAPPVVFLHGGGQTRFSWGRAVERVINAGFRAVSLDLRGHGESGWSPDGDYGVDRFVDDLCVVLPGLGAPAYLVGASLGGLAALTVAGEGRTPVRGLVLVDVTPRIESRGAERIGAFMRANPDGFATIDEAADAVSAYMPHRPRPKDVSGLRKNLRLGADGRYRWHWDPAFVEREISSVEIFHSRARLEAAARGLTVPTLLVRGSLSEVVSLEGVAHFRALVPHAEIVDIAGADHMVAGDRNDPFNDAVIDFLERHEAVGNLSVPIPEA